MKQERYISAHEAVDELGVSLTTLYAYVSRGLIRSEGVSGSRRVRLYSLEDIQRLKNRKEIRQHPENVASKALSWGNPVLDSELTLIRDDRVYYRGRDAVELALSWRVEQVAALLWGHENPENVQQVEQLFANAKPQLALLQELATFSEQTHLREMSLLEQFQTILPLVGNEDVVAYRSNQESTLSTGARLLWLFTCFLAHASTPQTTLAETLQQAWAPHNPQTVQLLNAALILNADNELNTSAFTARCVASTGSTLYGVVQGALAAFQGIQCKQEHFPVFKFVRSMDQPQQVKQVLVEHLKLGKDIPGFEYHRLLPSGDSRSVMLLQLLSEYYPESPATKVVEAIIAETHTLLDMHPRIEFAYAALALVLNLADEQALALFALARCIGWIAHALEQIRSKQEIRPRARYTGIQPQNTSH